MAYKINFEAYTENFSVPSRLAGEDLALVDGDSLKVALLIFKNSDKNYSANLISNLLNLPETRVEQAIGYWIEKGLLLEREPGILDKEVPVLRRHTAAQSLPPRPAPNSELAFLLECMENQLGRPVTSVEYKSVIHILEYIKLPADVVLMAIEYCISIDKANARYIEKVCATWADNGITTHETAEQYLHLLKQSHQNEDAVQKLFGIQNRSLIDSEKEMIRRWFAEYRFGIDVIRLAYERSITAISKLSFPYINKILSSWHEKGYASLEDIQANEGSGRRKAVEKKDGSSYDLEELERYWDKVPKLD